VISQPQRNKNTNITFRLTKYFAIDFFQYKILPLGIIFGGAYPGFAYDKKLL